jgi:hypothetical protein
MLCVCYWQTRVLRYFPLTYLWIKFWLNTLLDQLRIPCLKVALLDLGAVVYLVR